MNFKLMIDAMHAIHPFLETMSHDEAICFFGTAVDAFCSYRSLDPADFLRTLRTISKSVNETEGAYTER